VRIALLSTIQRAVDDPRLLLSTLSFAGMTIAERQLDLALALGCERVVCISQGLDKTVLALQHRTEAAGAKFNAIATPRALLGLVSAADELVVVAEGLLPDSEVAKGVLASGAAVLSLPVEAGVAAGFERIDLNRAWAGVAIMPGRLVEQLAQLPPDCDAVSALLRIALQGRVPERDLREDVLSERRWAMIVGAEDIGEVEPEWFRRHASPPQAFAPGRMAAGLAVRTFASTWLKRGWGSRAFWPGSVLAGAGGVVAAAFAHPVAGLLLCGIGWLLGEAASALRRIAAAGLEQASSTERLPGMTALFSDLCLAGVMVLALSGSWPDRVFAPVVLLALVHLCLRLLSQKWTELAQDRAILAIYLAIGAWFGLLLPFIQIACGAMIVMLLGLIRDGSRLTQT